MTSSVGVAAHPTRDAEYYFEDGNVVFLVEDVLFRIHKSRLVPYSQVLEDMFQSPKPSGVKSSSHLDGLSDNNPITIPQVKASAFRHLLLFFYGVITDSAYQTLVAEIVDDEQRTVTAFKNYLHISSLAHRFCMLSAEAWALSQFRRVLASPIHLAKLEWGHAELLDALTYVKVLDDSQLKSEVRNLIGCHFQKSWTHSLTRWGWGGLVPGNSINDNLRFLYKNDILKSVEPALFGFVFCSVLSEGYRSSIWASLTLEDRSKLLAAQVYLTPIPFSLLHLSWARKPLDIFLTIKQEARSECFPKCSDHFVTSIFPGVFDATYVQRLQANTPLTGILALRELPKLRRDISQSFNGTTMDCEKDCRKLIVRALDHKIDAVFEALCHSYHDKIL